MRTVIAHAALALAACHQRAISEDAERITVTVDAPRTDATVDALNAELRELAAPSAPSAPPVFGFRLAARIEAMNALRAHELDLGIYLRALRELSRRHPELAFTITWEPGDQSFELRGGSCGEWTDAFDRFIAGQNQPPAPSPHLSPPVPPTPISAQLPQIGAALGDKVLVSRSYVIEPSGALHEHEWIDDERWLRPATGLLRDLVIGVALPAAPADHTVRALAYASTGEAIVLDRWSEGPGRDVAQLRLVAPDGAIRSSPRSYGVSDLQLTRDRSQLVLRRIREGHPELARLELGSLTSSAIGVLGEYDAYAIDEGGGVVAYTSAAHHVIELVDHGEPREVARLPRGELWTLTAADRAAIWLSRRVEDRYELVRIDRTTGERRTVFPALKHLPVKVDRGWYAIVDGAVSLVDDTGVHPIAPADRASISAAPDGLLAVVSGEPRTLTLYRGTRELVGPTQIPPPGGFELRNAPSAR